MSRRILSPLPLALGLAFALVAAAPALAEAPAKEAEPARIPACCEQHAKRMDHRGHHDRAAREDVAADEAQGETPWWEQYPFVVPSDA